MTSVSVLKVEEVRHRNVLEKGLVHKFSLISNDTLTQYITLYDALTDNASSHLHLKGNPPPSKLKKYIYQ